MRWKGIKGDCWNRFIHWLYDDVISKCLCCIMGNWHYQQHKMVFRQKRFPIALLNGLINCISEHLGTSQEDFHEEFGAVSPLKPGLSGRGDFRILLLIRLDCVLEGAYFRKCERAKFDTWFTLFWDFKLWCKLVWNCSFFHFLFSKCNTVKWQRLITKVITVGKQRDSCRRLSFLWWPSLSWQLRLIPTVIILCGKICLHKGTGASMLVTPGNHGDEVIISDWAAASGGVGTKSFSSGSVTASTDGQFPLLSASFIGLN